MFTRKYEEMNPVPKAMNSYSETSDSEDPDILIEDSDNIIDCQCKAKTLVGEDCSRNALKGKDYCRQHQTYGNPVKIHPPFKIMIGRAIVSEHSHNGSTRHYIKMYLEANYNINRKSPYTNKAIKSMLDSGELIPNRYHSRHYRASLGLQNKVNDYYS